MEKDNLYIQVRSILDAVITYGDRAIEKFILKYDKTSINARRFLVSKQECKQSQKRIDPLLKKSLKLAARNILAFHNQERKCLKSEWFLKKGGVTTGQLSKPIEKVGIYIPGGRFPYPSTVLMTAIPAKVAGVKEVIMVTPAKNLTPGVLYAAAISGVSKIFRVGGPAAVAALAYGTDTIPKVDLIVGPGNKYVNEAKRQVFGQVGIDSLAGPSEVAIIADAAGNPEFIKSDLLAQVEHDPDAKAYLFTNCRNLLNNVNILINRVISEYKLKTHIKLVYVPSLKDAIFKINKLAPEHLEIIVKNPKNILSKIKNAGAIFIGNYSPTAIGDYWAGPSHVLPTGRTARYASGISVLTFLKRTSYINYSHYKIKNDNSYICKIADAEGLKYHKYSVKVRR
ncbi:MAG: histidinol dehydrogenase [Endomicrobiales bacterium]|nr:histidinol dehydrogenase [Endomicrobiales bacterium]